MGGAVPARYRPNKRHFQSGDSITVYGWPAYLKNRLEDAGDECRHVFVGKENGLFQTWNCAYAGATIENLRLGTGPVTCGAIGTALGSYPADSMFVHAGTNDICGGGLTAAQARDRMGLYLDAVFAAAPTIQVVLCQIIPPNPIGIYSGQAATIASYNALLPALAGTYLNRDIEVVDMNTGYPTADGFVDDLHPSPKGIAFQVECAYSRAPSYARF